MARYKVRHPVEAIQYLPDTNDDAVAKFLEGAKWRIQLGGPTPIIELGSPGAVGIYVYPSQWIVRDQFGVLTRYSPEMFEATFKAVE